MVNHVKHGWVLLLNIFFPSERIYGGVIPHPKAVESDRYKNYTLLVIGTCQWLNSTCDNAGVFTSDLPQHGPTTSTVCFNHPLKWLPLLEPCPSNQHHIVSRQGPSAVFLEFEAMHFFAQVPLCLSNATLRQGHQEKWWWTTAKARTKDNNNDNRRWYNSTGKIEIIDKSTKNQRNKKGPIEAQEQESTIKRHLQHLQVNTNAKSDNVPCKFF